MGIEHAFAEVLKRHRKLSALSQEALADAAGLDRTYISMLERGMRQPSLTTFLSLSNAMDIPPVTLLSETLEQLGEKDTTK